MNKQEAKRVSEIIDEINELSRYKDLLKSKDNGKVAHVNFVQHYGGTDDWSHLKVVFDHKYNNLFIPVFDRIISELEAELDTF